MITILALDISSTHIGVCYNGQPMETWKLPKLDIGMRCHTARVRLGALLRAASIDLIVVESPVARFGSAVIAQSRVSGALLSLVSELGIAWIELAPQKAKQALTGKGNADKLTMIAAASAATSRALDEHASDAYGLWLAALAVKVEKVAA